MKVDLEVERAAEMLDQRHCPAFRGDAIDDRLIRLPRSSRNREAVEPSHDNAMDDA